MPKKNKKIDEVAEQPEGVLFIAPHIDQICEISNEKPSKKLVGNGVVFGFYE